jgi:hypothetical protein
MALLPVPFWHRRHEPTHPCHAQAYHHCLRVKEESVGARLAGRVGERPVRKPGDVSWLYGRGGLACDTPHAPRPVNSPEAEGRAPASA